MPKLGPEVEEVAQEDPESTNTLVMNPSLLQEIQENYQRNIAGSRFLGFQIDRNGWIRRDCL